MDQDNESPDNNQLKALRSRIDKGLRQAERGQGVDGETFIQGMLQSFPIDAATCTESERTFQQLKARLEQGANEAERGELLDGDEVFEELRKMIETSASDEDK